MGDAEIRNHEAIPGTVIKNVLRLQVAMEHTLGCHHRVYSSLVSDYTGHRGAMDKGKSEELKPTAARAAEPQHQETPGSRKPPGFRTASKQ